MSRRVVRAATWCLAALAIVAASRGARAQGGVSGDTVDAVCFGFAFGTWSPPLDWRAAGHGDRLDTNSFIHAPGGRDWAAEAASPRDTVLMLFPVWWPAGVAVSIPARQLVVGDSVTGRAAALVADGRLQAPVAKVRAWRVRCDASSRSTPRGDSTITPVVAPRRSAPPRASDHDSSRAHPRPPSRASVPPRTSARELSRR